MIPLTENEMRINMVEITNPEFRITTWNLSVLKNENSNINTSAMIRILKNCSKKILLITKEVKSRQRYIILGLITKSNIYYQIKSFKKIVSITI